MLTITLSLFFLEKVGTFVVAHVFVTNINVIEKECHEGVGGRGGGIDGEFVTNIIINVVLNN